MADPLLRATWQSLRLSAKLGQGVTNAAVAGLEHAQEQRGARAARGGMVGPDDPPVPPEWTAGILDYRGLARSHELVCSPWSYRLGRLRHPGGRWRLQSGELGLSDAAVVRHAAVIGPTRSGKTNSIAVPWIYGALSSGRSVVAVDVQGDLWQSLGRYAATHGALNVNAFHWDYSDPARSSSWRWIDELDDDQAIEAAVGAILGQGALDLPVSSERCRDAQLLGALLGLGRLRGTTTRQLLDTLADRSRLEAFLSAFPYSDAVRRLRELLVLQPNEYVDAVNGVVSGLHPLATQEVSAITDSRGFNLELLSRRPTLLITGCPSAGGNVAETTASLMLALVSQRWLKGFAGTPMMLVLDEAPRISGRINLAKILSNGAGVGLATMLSAQDVSQFPDRNRDELLANCATMILLRGTGPASTSYFSKRLGKRPAVELSRSVGRKSFWAAPERGLSTASQMVEMIGHREITAPPFDGYPAIVHAPTIHPRPMLVDLRREDL